MLAFVKKTFNNNINKPFNNNSTNTNIDSINNINNKYFINNNQKNRPYFFNKKNNYQKFKKPILLNKKLIRRYQILKFKYTSLKNSKTKTLKMKMFKFNKVTRVYTKNSLSNKRILANFSLLNKTIKNSLLLKQNTSLLLKQRKLQLFYRLSILKQRKKLFISVNNKYYWYGQKRNLEKFLPGISELSAKEKNFYHKRQDQLPLSLFTTNQRLLSHYYLRYARYNLFYTNPGKKYEFLNNFFSPDRKLLKYYLHSVERFIYNRFPFKMQKFKTNYYFPNYSDYNHLYKNQIREQHTFRWLYRLSYKQLINMFKKAVKSTKRKYEFAFLKYLEFRLDTSIYRLNMAFSLKQARQWITKKFFMVNGVVMSWPKYQVNIGDVIMPIKELRTQTWPQQIWTEDFGLMYNTTRLFLRPIQADQYPQHFFLNERIPAAIVVSNPNPHKVYHARPWSVQFLTLSLLKYS